MVGSNGSRVQPSPGGTTSRCETRASAPPGAAGTDHDLDAGLVADHVEARPPGLPSTNRAIGSSSPLIEGIATSSRSRSSFSRRGRHRHSSPFPFVPTIIVPHAGAGEHLESIESGSRPSMMWVRSTPLGRGPDAGLHLGTHPAGQGAARHQLGQIVGIGEGHQRRGIVPVPQHPGRAGEEDQLLRLERDRERARPPCRR